METNKQGKQVRTTGKAHHPLYFKLKLLNKVPHIWTNKPVKKKKVLLSSNWLTKYCFPKWWYVYLHIIILNSAAFSYCSSSIILEAPGTSQNQAGAVLSSLLIWHWSAILVLFFLHRESETHFLTFINKAKGSVTPSTLSSKQNLEYFLQGTDAVLKTFKDKC